MNFTKADLVIIAGSIIVILVNIYSIAMGATGTGFFLSLFVILAFSILLINTVYRVTRMAQ